MAHAVAQLSFGAVTLNRPTDLAPSDKRKATWARAIVLAINRYSCANEQCDQWMVPTSPFLPDALKLTGAPQAVT